MQQPPAFASERIATLFVGFLLALAYIQPAAAQLMPPDRSICRPNDFWAACSKKVKERIKQTNDPQEALRAASEWAARYDALYRANPSNTWSITDQERLEEVVEKLWDEGIGKYLDPVGIALGEALKKYFPKIAAAVEFAGSTQVTFLRVLIEPSATATDFQAAGPDNREINKLLFEKIPKPTAMTLKERYPELFDKAYAQVTAQARKERTAAEKAASEELDKKKAIAAKAAQSEASRRQAEFDRMRRDRAEAERIQTERLRAEEARREQERRAAEEARRRQEEQRRMEEEKRRAEEATRQRLERERQEATRQQQIREQAAAEQSRRQAEEAARRSSGGGGGYTPPTAPTNPGGRLP